MCEEMDNIHELISISISSHIYISVYMYIKTVSCTTYKFFI